MNILNIEHVSKIFGEKKIFDDVSYGIHEGDKIGIIGINGTGKTTLLRMIMGQEETDEGTVTMWYFVTCHSIRSLHRIKVVWNVYWKET